MMHFSGRILTLAAAVLIAAAGCARLPETPSAAEKFPLQEAMRRAGKKHLEVNAFSAVQQRAGEFRSRERRLYLTELLREENSSAVSPAIIAAQLEDAIGSNHLLNSAAPSADLVKIQSVRSGQLLDLAVASAAVRLGAALRLYELGIAEARQELYDSEMELRNLTGATPSELARLDLSKLPKPYLLKTDLIKLQQFAAFNRPESAGTVIHPELPDDIRAFYRNDRKFLLIYTAALCDFYTDLSFRRAENDALCRRTVRLANAAGIAFQIEEDVKHLKQLYDACRLEELKLQLNKHPSVELQAKVIRLTAKWHLAWLKLRTDLGVTDFDLPLPEFPEQTPPELTAETALLFEVLKKKTLK